MSRRLEILRASLAKKEALFDQKLSAHMESVKAANGQPLNDKRNGSATLEKWDRQNDALRTLDASIDKTKRAIEREEAKIATVQAVALPDCIKALIDSGVLTQWRKHPRFFFVSGVDKARITLMDNGQIGHRYLSSITTKEQYAIFRDTFNTLKAQLSDRQEG
ncbi:hypothetical protein [Pseudomonas nitroreducens]|uniref:hypothetical protein n=1 Tax=Pseudomonas nitroreducens TaxID=46680 RepID=UPI002657C89B|nr:hypothetical protein [Pseudomonas nitroreducens]MCP1651658.1 hypothetical protein [Pseudomonas nitroreducens]MCP1684477.1 hypothetical protein [Pseudomonas nitroreducens]